MADMNLLKMACLTAVNSAYVSFDNHSMNNIFIENDPVEVARGLAREKVTPIGFCFNIPYCHYVATHIAFVVEENETVKWVHFPLISYQNILRKLFGPDMAKRIEASVKNGEDYMEAIA